MPEIPTHPRPGPNELDLADLEDEEEDLEEGGDGEMEEGWREDRRRIED